jgi:hypothetical protein
MKLKDIQKVLKQAHEALTEVDCSATYKKLFDEDDERTVTHETLLYSIRSLEAVMDDLGIDFDSHRHQ